MLRKKYFQPFLGCDSEYEESDIVVFGAPFDGTTTFRPGARFAPELMRIESYGLETYSPYLEKDLETYKIFDMGDLELPFGNVSRVLEKIETNVKKILEDDKIPCMIGGEHLVSLAAISACYQKYNEIIVIHLDAHTDLREDYMEEKYSHSTVMRNVWEILGDGKIYQFGIRSGLKSEFEWAERGHTELNKFNLNKLKESVKLLKDTPVYLTIDLDVLDPSVFPGTGTPEPGGINFGDLQEAIKKMEVLNIVGMDIVELAPHYDHSGASTAVACKVLREILLTVSK